MEDLLERVVVRVASRDPEFRRALTRELRKVAQEFDTPEALGKYLKDHPAANPKNHSVKSNGKGKTLDKDSAKKLLDSAGAKVDSLEKTFGSLGNMAQKQDGGKSFGKRKKMLAEAKGILEELKGANVPLALGGGTHKRLVQKLEGVIKQQENFQREG